ncbi:MAG: ABC transporter permease [Propionibacteriaceae bacterium]|jgi:ABC-2 type transport system permease protein|nr:ABC transporter permease [Propionibacteriaceae bacterium]
MSLKRIRLLVWKEFMQLKRDPLLLRLLAVMPIMMLLLLGYVVGAEIKDLKMAVVDLDHSPTSRKLESAFTASGFFVVTRHLTSETQMKPLLDDGEVLLVLVVPKDTGALVNSGQVAPIGLVVDGSNSQVSTVASGYAMQIMQTFNAQIAAESGVSLSMPGIDAQVRVEYNPTMAPINAMIPGLMCMIMMMSLMAIMSMAVVREEESGALEQMFITPIRPGEYIIGKVTPYAAAAFVQSVFVGTLGAWWFQVPFIGNIWLALAGLALFLLSSLGLGLLISLISSTRQQSQQAVVFILIPSMVLSGFVFPLEAMPAWIAWIPKFIPLTHILVIMRAAFMKHADFTDMAVPLLSLAALAVAVFTSAVFATRHRLTS